MCIEALRIKIVWNHDRLLQAHVSTDCRKYAHGIVDSYHVHVFRNDDSGLLDSLRSIIVHLVLYRISHIHSTAKPTQRPLAPVLQSRSSATFVGPMPYCYNANDLCKYKTPDSETLVLRSKHTTENRDLCDHVWISYEDNVTFVM